MPTVNRESPLLEPGRIGGLELKNRFVRSATAELLATGDGSRLTDRYLRMYELLARGGVGLIITGNLYIEPMGRALPNQLLAHRDGVIDELRRVAAIVRPHSARLIAQLNHAGRQTTPALIGARPLAPSAVRDRLSLVKPRALEHDEIEAIIAAFAAAARRVRAAGLDGVQIHAAHGYLVNQFLSGYTNRRTDGWGGPLANRMRFLAEVYDAIRAAVGDDYPVLIKLNGEDFVPGGVTLEETIAVCRMLDERGIDAIEVSGGIGEGALITSRGDLPMDLAYRDQGLFTRAGFRLKEKALRRLAHFEEGYFRSQAAAVKRAVRAPVLAVGGLRRRVTMEQVLAAGAADFISLSRPFIRQPNLVNQMAGERPDPISCTNCNRCSLEVVLHHNPLRCYVNEAPKPEVVAARGRARARRARYVAALLVLAAVVATMLIVSP